MGTSARFWTDAKVGKNKDGETRGRERERSLSLCYEQGYYVSEEEEVVHGFLAERVKDVISQSQTRTCSDDMKDARLRLLSHAVAAPTHESPVLERSRGCEGQDARGPVGPDESLLDLLGLCGIVERPPESDLGRIGLDATCDVGCLHLGHAVHLDPARSADWRNWNGKKGRFI